MHAFTHRRRWSAAVVAAVLALALSGCTIGYVSIPAGHQQVVLGCPPGVDLGPGHLSARPNIYSPYRYWVMPPQVARLRFAVTRSSSTWPISAFFSFPGTGPGFNLNMWDGTASRGGIAIDMQYFSSRSIEIVLAIEAPSPPPPWDFDVVLEAVDANGNDLGLSCSMTGAPLAPGT